MKLNEIPVAVVPAENESVPGPGSAIPETLLLVAAFAPGVKEQMDPDGVSRLFASTRNSFP